MKYITYALASCSIIVLFVFVILTIETKAAREVEINDALPAAVEGALEETAMKGTYTYENKEEYIADFTSLLLQQINASAEGDSDFKLKVDIANADEEKHLISVHVTAEYTQPNGSMGKCEVTRTAILENEHQRNVYTISYYYYNEELYSDEEKKHWTNADGTVRIEPLCCTYEVVEGEEIPKVQIDTDICYKGETVSFSGWIDMDTNTSFSEGMKADRNMNFVLR